MFHQHAIKGPEAGADPCGLLGHALSLLLWNVGWLSLRGGQVEDLSTEKSTEL